MEKKQNVPALRFPGFSGEWKERKISDIADIIGGGTPSTSEPAFWDGEIDWYAPAEMTGKRYADGSARKITKLGLENSHATILPADKTVLFTSRAGIGKVAILKKPAATNQGFQSMVLREDNNPYFLYSMGPKITQKAEKVASGSTFLEISGKGLGEISINLPVPLEQERIAHLFEKLDDFLETQKDEIKKLQQFRQAMLTKLFPREGAAEPELRFRGFSGKWEYKSLGSLANITSGFLGDATLTAGKYRLTRIETIANNEVDERKIGYSNKDPGNMYLLAKGDILYSNINSYEHIGKVARYHGKSVLYHGINLLRLSPYKQVEPSFLEYLLKTESRKKWAKSHANRAVNQASINASLLASQKVPVCEMDEQKAIGAFFDNLQIYISLQQKKLERMQRLKAALLEKLFV